MTDRNGGENAQRLAPVIPLFGASPQPGTPGEDRRASDGIDGVVPRRTGEAGLWRSTWSDESDERLSRPSDRHPAHGGRAPAAATDDRGQQPIRLRALSAEAGDTGRPGEEQQRSRGSASLRGGVDDTDEDASVDPSAVRAHAEEGLVRKLRSRAMSVSEARTVLRENGLDREQSDQVVDDFERRGYLDDHALAGHLVTSGIERKGQGRVALSRALTQRGIPRDVIDDALSTLPNDDAERALEFARGKARSMARVEPDAALRRLVGQLSRRGYSGSVSMEAARTALREVSGGAPRGVRFVESD